MEESILSNYESLGHPAPTVRDFPLLLATLTSLGLAFGSEYLNTTFRTPEEVVSFLNIPVLAAMPQNGPDGKKLGEGI
jgi:hypothetical protein